MYILTHKHGSQDRVIYVDTYELHTHKELSE